MTTNTRIFVDPAALASPGVGRPSQTDPRQQEVEIFVAEGVRCTTWLAVEQAGQIASAWIRLVTEMTWREYGFDGSPMDLLAATPSAICDDIEADRDSSLATTLADLEMNR